jgi:hypothetical protein
VKWVRDETTAKLRKGAQSLSDIAGLEYGHSADFISTGISYGYIGNVWHSPYQDDRVWYFFAPHPGRVGTYADRRGGFDNADQLLDSYNARREWYEAWARGRRC